MIHRLLPGLNEALSWVFSGASGCSDHISVLLQPVKRHFGQYIPAPTHTEHTEAFPLLTPTGELQLPAISSISKILLPVSAFYLLQEEQNPVKETHRFSDGIAANEI